MTNAIREFDASSPSGRDGSATACPLCHSRHQTDMFEMRQVPVDTCFLWTSREKALQADLGDIVLSFCRTCGFVRNRIHDQSRVSFRPGYEASLTYSSVFNAFQRKVAERLIERYELRNKTVIEIGCGHGEFLRLLSEIGDNRCVGFDPTLPGESIEPVGGGSLQLVPDLYSSQHAHLEPDFLCCLSVLEDIPNPSEFLETIKTIVGTARPKMYFEIFNAFRAFEEKETWSIHYEQCNYFGIDSFTHLFERSGFEILEAGTCYEGDQYLYAVVVPQADGSTPSSQVGALQPLPPEVATFTDHHATSTNAWRSRLARFEQDRLRVVAWGSGGKGTSFLNALPTKDAISYVVDINPNRQGRYIGGSGQKIVAPDFLAEYRPDVVVITNPLYEREIKAQVNELGVSCEFMFI